MVWGLQLPFVFHGINRHINLITWITLDAIESPSIVVPDDPVIGICIVVAAVHLEEMGAFMLRCFWEIKIGSPFVLPRPVKCEHVRPKGFVTVRFDQLRLEAGKTGTFLYVNIRWETVPVHDVFQGFDGCVRLPAERMQRTPGPVDTILKECLKERHSFFKAGNTVHVTLGYFTMALGVVVKEFVSYIARPIRKIVIQICHVQKIPVYTGIILPSHSSCC